MSDDDDSDFTSTHQSSKNLATLFHGIEPKAPPVAAPTSAYVPPKQPKKDSTPRIMTASVIQAYQLSADQKWTPRGKLGVAILSTDNTMFQLILYQTKTQHITSARITPTSVFTAQANNYLSFQDDGGQSWSIMFETKQAFVDFALQLVLAKAYLSAFKFDHIIQDIRDGDGSAVADQDSVEITVILYKLLENGTLSPPDSGENKPVRFKIGKNQNGKGFDDSLRGMKKNGQRITMIGKTVYNIEVVRVKREKEVRSGSTTSQTSLPLALPTEDQTPIDRKRTTTEDNEVIHEKNNMLERIKKNGGQQMFPPQNRPSAFVPQLQSQLSDDDSSIYNEIGPHSITTQPVPTHVLPPTQFAKPPYHHPHPHHPIPAPYQPLYQPSALYSPQQPPPPDYTSRPDSAMSYQPTGMWPLHAPYHQSTPNVPPTDMYYPQAQQPFPSDPRHLLSRLNDKVDALTEKFDAKNSTSYPNMETSIVLANIQKIVKENDTMKKDLFDRSAKIEELNLKISDLLDRNQRLIEQTHQTAEQRNVVVNNVSEQTAQKILELEKQKVELTNNLSISTSKIAELQLQLNQHSQGVNDNQSRLSSLLHKCEQYKEDLETSENHRSDLQIKYDSTQEQLKNEKILKKQLQTHFNELQEELAEIKVTCQNLEKGSNERKTKYENERKRWQEDLDDQKQSYEKELDELRAKLRKQRTTDSLTNNQEISRIEQDLEKDWQDKLDRQQVQFEKLLSSKTKEFEQFKITFTQNETKLQEVTEELNESKQQIEAYEERCEKLQERLTKLKEKLIEMNDEQPQLVNDQVKRAINIIFQSLKTRIQPTKQYTGEQFLSRTLEIIKKATFKVLSNNEEDEEHPSTDEEQSNDEEEQQLQTSGDVSNNNNDQPSNGDSVDQKTLSEEVSSILNNQDEQKESNDNEVNSTNTQKNGWDTVDDLQQESKNESEPLGQNQMIVVTEDTTSTANETETETESTNPVIETNEQVPSSETAVAEEHDTDGSADTVEENDEKEPSTNVELPTEKVPTDDESEDEEEIFKSARPSMQDAAPVPQPVQQSPKKNTFNNKDVPVLNPDDSDDELFK